MTLSQTPRGKNLRHSDIAFFCLPHGQMTPTIPETLRHDTKVIDLSADYRFRNANIFQKTYRVNHPQKKLLAQAVYGLPEIYRDQIREAFLIGNPGCYATTCILAMAPLMSISKRTPNPLSIVKDRIVIDAKSGVSGAGKKLSLSSHFVEVQENLSPYAPLNHRHVPEVEQELSALARRPIHIVFVPHLIPMQRGIIVTCYVELKKQVSEKQLREHFQNYYRDEPFVRILPEGQLPQTQNVSRTNFCDIGFAVDKRSQTAVVMATLDNLVKGAAGCAIQNMNLMTDSDESAGLV